MANDNNPSIAWQQEELRRIEEEGIRLQNQRRQLQQADCCSICLDDSDQNLKLTVCKHKFHEHCLMGWLNTNTTCPLCRTPNCSLEKSDSAPRE